MSRRDRERNRMQAATATTAPTNRMVPAASVDVPVEASRVPPSTIVAPTPIPVAADADGDTDVDDEGDGEGEGDDDASNSEDALDVGIFAARAPQARALTPPPTGHFPAMWRAGRDAAIASATRPTPCLPSPPLLPDGRYAGCRQCWTSGRDAALTVLDPERRLR